MVIEVALFTDAVSSAQAAQLAHLHPGVFACVTLYVPDNYSRARTKLPLGGMATLLNHLYSEKYIFHLKLYEVQNNFCLTHDCVPNVK